MLSFHIVDLIVECFFSLICKAHMVLNAKIILKDLNKRTIWIVHLQFLQLSPIINFA